MTDRQKVVFSIICDEPGPHHVRDLARDLNIDKSVVSRICDKLDDAGLISHARDPKDGRDCTLQPTSRGYEIRAGMRALLVQ